MAKKDKRVKKANAKRERYSKFHKEKPAQLNISMPELSPEAQKLKQEQELKINQFWRYNRPLKLDKKDKKGKR
jgi:hypothetical protein